MVLQGRLWLGEPLLIYGVRWNMLRSWSHESIDSQSSDANERGTALSMLAFVTLFCTGAGRVLMGLFLHVLTTGRQGI